MIGKLENGRLVQPTGKVIIIANPTEEDYKKIGYKEVEDNVIEEQEGMFIVPEYTETEDKIIINYHYEPVEEPEEEQPEEELPEETQEPEEEVNDTIE